MVESRPAVERAQPPKGPFVALNALMRAVLRSPLGARLGNRIVLLSYTGRKTRRSYCVPVAVHELDGRLLTLTSSMWRHNFHERAPVTVRRAGQDLHLTALLQDDPDKVATTYTSLIARIGHERAGRQLGIRINVERMPTHEELADASRRSGLSVVSYEPRA